MINKNVFTVFITALIALASVSAAAYTVPANNRVKFNIDIGWKLNVGDVTGAQAATFNDASWKTISLPYSWNQDDAFAVKSGSVSQGIAWYRKHFSLPVTYAGCKVFVEFEEIRQAGEVYCNGTLVGRSENGVSPSGFDITSLVHIDGTDNVIAVKTDNSYDYTEVSSGTRFQWSTGSYTTNFGGITQNAYLHVTPKCYQTLPLIVGLNTVGTYIYGKNYIVSGGASAAIPTGSADITASSQVKNESGASQTVGFQVDIVDKDGNLVKTLNGAGATIAAGAAATVTVTGNVPGLNLWSLGYGYLYDVYTILSVGGTATDVVKTRTGFRKMEYGGGIAKINDRMYEVKGFAWRSQDPWPALGDGVPIWLRIFQDSLMLALGGNTVRPMHVAALRTEIEAADIMGLTYAMPAGDAENAVTGAQWNQRKEAMRDQMVYSKNNPSVLWYEAGNSDISDNQMQEMIDTMTKYDPSGGRLTGCRGMVSSKVAQYGGEMLYVDKSAYKPMWMNEYSRNESPRRWWDQYSPPEFHANDAGASTVAGMNMNQDAYIQEECNRWWEYYTERPGSGTGPGTRANLGGAKIEMCDGTTFARSDENYRRSGVVDAMRIPKDAYGAFKCFWDGWIEVDNKDVYIVGHWTYPSDTKKNTEYVVSNCDKVELFVNNVSKGFGKQSWKFLFTFPNAPYAPGTVKAVGYKADGTQVAVDQRTTAGAAAAIRLTSHISAAGLRATGADIALFDAEVTDANGNRCPTASNTITWAVTGPGEYRGGMAGNHTGAPANYILATSFPVECGISRISVRASSTPGDIKVTASSSGLTGASATVTSSAFPITNGLTTVMPNDGLPLNLTPLPPYKLLNPAPKTLAVTSSAGNATYDDNEKTSWSGSSITYNLASAQMVSQVHVKFTDFRNAHTWKVAVGGTQAWSGTTDGGLGYSDVSFTPVSGSSVTISSSGSLPIYETEIYGPGVVGVQPAQPPSVSGGSFIRKYQDRVNITLPGPGYKVNLMDLFGRIVEQNQHQKKDLSAGMVSISTRSLARGVYLIEVLKDKQSVQKEVLFIQ